MMMNSPIDQLVQELWDECVIRRAAKDQEMAQRWQSDEISHLKEGFLVRAIPDELQSLVLKAIAQWEEIEKKKFNKFDLNKERFLEEFEKARESFWIGNQEWRKFIVFIGSDVQGVFRNLDWVNLFSWILPKADPNHSVKHRTIGKMVTSIFYLELLSKYSKKPNGDINHPLNKIEARWCIISEANPRIEKRIV
jgi:hypothetical protein